MAWSVEFFLVIAYSRQVGTHKHYDTIKLPILVLNNIQMKNKHRNWGKSRSQSIKRSKPKLRVKHQYSHDTNQTFIVFMRIYHYLSRHTYSKHTSPTFLVILNLQNGLSVEFLVVLWKSFIYIQCFVYNMILIEFLVADLPKDSC